MRRFYSRLGLVFMLAALAWAGGIGCRSTSLSDPAGFAGVDLQWSTPRQVTQVTRQVFQEHGFTPNTPGLLPLVFEKNASGVDNAAYGNWIGDVPLRLRAKVSLLPVTEGTYRLQCTACLVRDSGGTTEEEIAVSKMRRKAFQDMLQEIATRLKALPKEM